MNKPFIAGVYIRDVDGCAFTTVGGTEVTIVSWLGPYKSIAAAADWISEANNGQPKENQYEIHDFT